MRGLAACTAALGLAFTVVTIAHAETAARRASAKAVESVQPSRLATPAPRGTRVAVLGDSISYLSESAFAERFAARGFVAPVISGIPGIRSDERVFEGAALVGPSKPAVLVIELGTNDVGSFLEEHPLGTADEREAHARRVAANQRQLADSVGPQLQCIVVVNVSANTLAPATNEVARAEDRALDDWARDDPRVRIADWDALLADEFTRAEPNGSMTSDTVHPTPYGATRLADLVVDTIDACGA